MKDVGERMFSSRPHQHMDMVGHDDPFVELVAVAVEVDEGVGNHLSQAGVFQEARACAFVEPLVDAFGKEFVETGAFGFGVGGLMVFLPFLAQRLVFLDARLRDGVGQAEGDEIGAFVLRPVREVFAVGLVDWFVWVEAS